MTARLEVVAFPGSLAKHLARRARPKAGAVSLFWLGQAGFLVLAGEARILIDPYLSDSLREKYAGSATPHDRMMPPPITPDALGRVDLILCTHRHTDHMDPGTLQPLAARWPDLRLVVPAAETGEALARAGVASERLVPMEAGEAIEPLPGLRVRAVRAAHETLETDGAGRHRFLGFAVACEGVTIFHSGDTVPFRGQREEVAGLDADLALLPVNGRSAALRAAGVPGNMTADEALALAQGARVPAVIAHHYGLFRFNTADPAELDTVLAQAPRGVRAERARLGIEYRLEAAVAKRG